MKIRDAILVLLARQPSHGYQLKVDYERLTGSAPVNVGQIYTTLERLERDGLVSRDPAGNDRRVIYVLTGQGLKAALAWIEDTGTSGAQGRSAVAGKLLLAMAVPGVEIDRVIDVHRVALLDTVRATRRQARGTAGSAGPEGNLESRMIIEAEVAVIEAELRWLDLFEAELRSTRRRM